MSNDSNLSHKFKVLLPFQCIIGILLFFLKKTIIYYLQLIYSYIYTAIECSNKYISIQVDEMNPYLTWSDRYET